MCKILSGKHAPEPPSFVRSPPSVPDTCPPPFCNILNVTANYNTIDYNVVITIICQWPHSSTSLIECTRSLIIPHDTPLINHLSIVAIHCPNRPKDDTPLIRALGLLVTVTSLKPLLEGPKDIPLINSVHD